MEIQNQFGCGLVTCGKMLKANLKHRGSANQRIIDCKTGDDVTLKYDPLGVMP